MEDMISIYDIDSDESFIYDTTGEWWEDDE